MTRVSENSPLKKKLFRIVFFWAAAIVSIQKMASSENQTVISKDVFNTYLLPYALQMPLSIKDLKKNYYNLCLLSQEHNEKTKAFWNKHWFSIMKHVCTDYRYERLYFAGIFYHSHNDIKQYFENNLFVYKKLLYLSSNEGMISPPTIEWLDSLDPNLTLFGPNCQMSILECCIKASFYPVKNKTELCIQLIKRGAQYDIWIYQGIHSREKLLGVIDNTMNEKISDSSIRGPMLLSEFIALHKRCNFELAKIIVEKGSCMQDLFIERYPELEILRKEKRSQPKRPDNFIDNHHFSELRYLYLFFTGVLIPYFMMNGYTSMFEESENYERSIKYETEYTGQRCISYFKNLKRNLFYYFDETGYASFLNEVLYEYQTKESKEKNRLLFCNQYGIEQKDAEGNTAHKHLKKLSLLTTIPINSINGWLKEIVKRLSNYTQNSADKHPNISQLEKYINEKSIPIQKDTTLWLTSLADILEAVQGKDGKNKPVPYPIQLLTMIKKNILRFFAMIQTLLLKIFY